MATLKYQKYKVCSALFCVEQKATDVCTRNSTHGKIS